MGGPNESYPEIASVDTFMDLYWDEASDNPGYLDMVTNVFGYTNWEWYVYVKELLAETLDKYNPKSNTATTEEVTTTPPPASLDSDKTDIKTMKIPTYTDMLSCLKKYSAKYEIPYNSLAKEAFMKTYQLNCVDVFLEYPLWKIYREGENMAMALGLHNITEVCWIYWPNEFKDFYKYMDTPEITSTAEIHLYCRCENETVSRPSYEP